MSLIETAIRAACAADTTFTLNRRPQLAEKCVTFILSFPEANAEAVYIHAEQKPGWQSAKPQARSAWEIFRATLLILSRIDCEEKQKAVRAAPANRVPQWMVDNDEQEAPGLGDRIVPMAPRLPIAPAPEKLPLPERKRVGRRA